MNGTALSKSTSNRLHTLRWGAAIVVLLGHVEMVAKWRTGLSIWPWAYEMAHLAVMSFFVLSGFIIAHVSMRTSGLSTYMQERATRIYSVLFPTILLTILLDTFGSQINQVFYGSYSVSDQYVVRFIVNILGLQGWQGHRVQFGTNSPLWSIGYEMFFYITYGLIFYKLAKPGLATIKKLIWGGAALLIVVAAGIEMASYFLIWLLGVLAFRLQGKYRLGGYGHILSALLLYFSIMMLDPGYWRDLIFSLGVGVFLISPDGNGHGFAFNEFMANFSFSLYALHLPLIFFLFAVFWDEPISLSFFASAITALTVVTAYMFSLAFEKRRYVFRTYLTLTVNRLSQVFKR